MEGFSVGFPEVFHFKTPRSSFFIFATRNVQALKLFSAGFSSRISSILLSTNR